MSTLHSNSLNSSSKTYTNQTALHHATGSTALESKESTSIWHPSRGIRFSSTSLSPHSGTTDGHFQEENVLERMASIPTRRRQSSPTEKPRVESLPPETLGRETQENKTPRSGEGSSLDVRGQLSGLASQSLGATLRCVNEAIILEQSTEDISESSCGITLPLPDSSDPGAGDSHLEISGKAPSPGTANVNPLLPSESPGKPRPKGRDYQTSRPADAFLGERSHKLPEVPSNEVTAQSSLAHVLAPYVTTARSFENPRSARAKTSSRFKQIEHELDLGPEYRKLKKLRKRVINSGHDLRDSLRTILDELDRRDMAKELKPWEKIIPFQIAWIECRVWLDDFKRESHRAAVFLRLREEWDALLQGRKVKRFASGSDMIEWMGLGRHAIRLHPCFASFTSLSLHLHLLLTFHQLHRRNPRLKASRILRSSLGFEYQKRLFSLLTDLNATNASMLELGKQIKQNQLRATEQCTQFYDSIFALQTSLSNMDHIPRRTAIIKRLIGRVRLSLQFLIQSSNQAINAMNESARSGGTTELASPLAKYLLQWNRLGEGKPQLDTMTLCASRDKPKTANPPTYLQPKDFKLEGMAQERHVESTRMNKPEREESSPYIQHHTPPRSVRYCSSVTRPEFSRSLFSGNSTSRTPSTAGFHSLAAARIEGSGSTDDGNSQDDVVGLAGSPLGYHIPSAKMRESLLASRSSRSAFWQYTFYQGPNGEKVKVHYCKSLETTERIAKLFLNESVVGFDIEWKPSATAKDGIRKNVALIQIASEERIALFHIARFAKGDTVDEVVSPTFKRLMESDSISKVGVSVKGDCSRLRKYMNIESRGLFELSHLYKLVKFCPADVKKINKVLVGLAKQVEEHLLLPMYKDESVRGSDWSEDLNYEQIYYAASDSYAGLQLYHIMNNKRRSIDPSPPLPAHADLNLPIRLANGQTVAEYEECSMEEPAMEEDKETKPLPPAIEQLVEDVKNVQIEDKPSARSDQKFMEEKSEEVHTQPQQRRPTSLSSHPAIIAANEWLTEYRLRNPLTSITSSSTTTAESTLSSDITYPTLPTLPSPITANISPSPSSTTTTATTTLPSSSPSTTRKPSKQPPHPHQKTAAAAAASPASLRAYHLFFHQNLDVETIAALLRDPPLQRSTVMAYVLEAVRAEGFVVHGEEGRGRLEGLEREADRGRVGRWMRR